VISTKNLKFSLLILSQQLIAILILLILFMIEIIILLNGIRKLKDSEVNRERQIALIIMYFMALFPASIIYIVLFFLREILK